MNVLTILFSDGFEEGNLSAWSGTEYGSGGSAPKVESSVVHSGVYACLQALSGEAGAYSGCNKVLGSSYNALHARAYVLFSALPTGNANFVQVAPDICTTGDAQDLVVVWLRNNGSGVYWSIYWTVNGGSTNYALSNVTPITGIWYCVEVYVNLANGMGEVTLWVNGTKLVDVTGLSNGTYSASEVLTDAYCINGLAVNVYVDDVVVADSYIGPMYTPTFRSQRFQNNQSVSVSVCKPKAFRPKPLVLPVFKPRIVA